MNTSIVAAIVTLVVGGAVGFGIGSMSNDDTDMANETQTQQSMQSMESMESTDTVDGVTVGGAKMVRTLDIVDNAANASNVSTVVDLVKQAGLVDTLKGVGPFTVFGPTNEAFEAVPTATLNKVAGDNELLKTVLTYHVLPGTYTSADLRAMANQGKSIKTVQGAELSFMVVDGGIAIKDVAGQMVMIETPDVISSNGVTHVIKNVLLPVDPATL